MLTFKSTVTHKYNLVGRCLILHLSPQDKISPMRRINVYTASSCFILSCTCSWVIFFLNLPIGIGRSWWFRALSWVNSSLTTVYCEYHVNIMWMSFDISRSICVHLIYSIFIVIHPSIQPSIYSSIQPSIYPSTHPCSVIEE